MSKVRSSNGEAPTSLVRIGELARRAGVPTSTLRAWERRYGVREPIRGDSGYRLYSESDERRLRRMLDLVGSGLAPAEAARRVREEREGAGDEEATAAGDLRDELAEALAAFDEHRANLIMDRAVTILSTDALLGDLLLPVLRGLHGGTIGQEHFASNLVRGRLTALARGWGAGAGRLALLACPGGEQHDLGLIAFGLALRARGWRISFLGADTPITALAVAADEIEPEVVVLSAFTEDAFERIESDLVALAAQRPVQLAGPGAAGAMAERVGAARLAEGPVLAADSFTVA